MKSEKYKLHFSLAICSNMYFIIFHYSFFIYFFHLFFHLTFCYKKTNMTPTNWRIGKHDIHALHHHHLSGER